jgi:lipoprotein-anchoring transpeptidase ErfK/SrfK
MATARRRGRAVAVVLAALTGCGTGPVTGLPTPAPTPRVTVPSATPSPTPTPSVTMTATPTATASPAPTSATTLSLGDHGPAVLALQERLDALGYWLGPVDGTFGGLTRQAVYALQKATGLSRDGRVGPATRRALAAGVRPSPRSTTGRVVEIDLERQLLLVVHDGRLLTALNTSTGSGGTYWSEGRLRLAVTPRGRFHVYTQVDGLRVSPLGQLWRPKYFHGGIAVHGYDSVPPWPASHGCVRVSDAAIDRIWAEDLVPVGTAVWVL